METEEWHGYCICGTWYSNGIPLLCLSLILNMWEKAAGVITMPTHWQNRTRGFVLKFEKLGLLRAARYGNRIKYRIEVREAE